MVGIMGRRKKIPTKPVRLREDILERLNRNAKKRKMSLPDYLAWRLSR